MLNKAAIALLWVSAALPAAAVGGVVGVVYAFLSMLAKARAALAAEPPAIASAHKSAAIAFGPVAPGRLLIFNQTDKSVN